MTTTNDLPDVFAPYLAGLEEMRWPDAPASAFRSCFGCGPAHPTGLHVRCFGADDGVVSPIVVPHVYEGPPGAAHGGIVAAYLDEVCGAASLRGTGRLTVTGELSVRYLRPVPLEVPLLGRGAVVRDHGKYVDVEARLEELGTARLLATARGRFFDYRRR